MFDNPDSVITGVGVSSSSDKTKASKPWSERIKSGHQSMAKYFAEYGTKTGLAGGTLLIMGGAATLMGAASATTPEAVEAARSASSAMMLGGVLKMGAMSVAEHVAKLHLKGIDSLFEGAETTQNTNSDAGASLKEDPIFQDPSFKKAVVSTIKELQSDPDTRADVIEMLTNSPQARQALLNAQKQIEEAAQMRQQSAQPGQTNAHSTATESEQQGPSLH